MTDDTGATGSGEAEPSAADELQEAVKNVSDQLTGGERLIAIGALLILILPWLLGTLILDEYGLSNSSVLIPVGLLAAMYLYYTAAEAPWHPLYGTIVKAGAWSIAIIAVYDIVDDTLITGNRFNGWTLFFALVFYVAGALCAVGAWQLKGDVR